MEKTITEEGFHDAASSCAIDALSILCKRADESFDVHHNFDETDEVENVYHMIMTGEASRTDLEDVSNLVILWEAVQKVCKCIPLKDMLPIENSNEIDIPVNISRFIGALVSTFEVVFGQLDPAPSNQSSFLKSFTELFYFVDNSKLSEYMTQLLKNYKDLYSFSFMFNRRNGKYPKSSVEKVSEYLNQPSKAPQTNLSAKQGPGPSTIRTILDDDDEDDDLEPPNGQSPLLHSLDSSTVMEDGEGEDDESSSLMDSFGKNSFLAFSAPSIAPLKPLGMLSEDDHDVHPPVEASAPPPAGPTPPNHGNSVEELLLSEESILKSYYEDTEAASSLMNPTSVDYWQQHLSNPYSFHSEEDDEDSDADIYFNNKRLPHKKQQYMKNLPKSHSNDDPSISHISIETFDSNTSLDSTPKRKAMTRMKVTKQPKTAHDQQQQQPLKSGLKKATKHNQQQQQQQPQKQLHREMISSNNNSSANHGSEHDNRLNKSVSFAEDYTNTMAKNQSAASSIPVEKAKQQNTSIEDEIETLDIATNAVTATIPLIGGKPPRSNARYDRTALDDSESEDEEPTLSNHHRTSFPYVQTVTTMDEAELDGSELDLSDNEHMQKQRTTTAAATTNNGNFPMTVNKDPVVRKIIQPRVITTSNASMSNAKSNLKPEANEYGQGQSAISKTNAAATKHENDDDEDISRPITSLHHTGLIVPPMVGMNNNKNGVHSSPSTRTNHGRKTLTHSQQEQHNNSEDSLHYHSPKPKLHSTRLSMSDEENDTSSPERYITLHPSSTSQKPHRGMSSTNTMTTTSSSSNNTFHSTLTTNASSVGTFSKTMNSVQSSLHSSNASSKLFPNMQDSLHSTTEMLYSPQQSQQQYPVVSSSFFHSDTSPNTSTNSGSNNNSSLSIASTTLGSPKFKVTSDPAERMQSPSKDKRNRQHHSLRNSKDDDKHNNLVGEKLIVENAKSNHIAKKLSKQQELMTESDDGTLFRNMKPKDQKNIISKLKQNIQKQKEDSSNSSSNNAHQDLPRKNSKGIIIHDSEEQKEFMTWLPVNRHILSIHQLPIQMFTDDPTKATEDILSIVTAHKQPIDEDQANLLDDPISSISPMPALKKTNSMSFPQQQSSSDETKRGNHVEGNRRLSTEENEDEDEDREEEDAAVIETLLGMSEFALSTGIIIEGALQKKSYKWGFWQPRYLILQESSECFCALHIYNSFRESAWGKIPMTFKCTIPLIDIATVTLLSNPSLQGKWFVIHFVPKTETPKGTGKMNRLLSSFTSLFASGDTKQSNKSQMRKGTPKLTQHSLQNTGNDTRMNRNSLNRPTMMSMSTATGSEDAMDDMDEAEEKSNHGDNLSDAGSMGSATSSVNSDRHYGGKILQMTLQTETAEVAVAWVNFLNKAIQYTQEEYNLAY